MFTTEIKEAAEAVQKLIKDFRDGKVRVVVKLEKDQVILGLIDLSDKVMK